MISVAWTAVALRPAYEAIEVINALVEQCLTVPLNSGSTLKRS